MVKAVAISLALLYRQGGMQKMILVSEAWRAIYPGASVGILVMRNVCSLTRHPMLGKCKDELETELRNRFADCSRDDLKALEPIKAYNAYLKPYKKTYPVQLQLESVVFKGQSIPNVATLVEAMFMAELKNLLLTAGHDLDMLKMPVTLDVARGDERYLHLSGQEQVLKAGDMMMSDRQGVISSVVYGPDHRTAITPGTRHVLFAVYGVLGIGKQAIYQHLQDIQTNVLLIAPEAETELLKVYGTD
jgi:DNA/RNA-binding domain of Phe-tRNA-synthetase-like protein